ELIVRVGLAHTAEPERSVAREPRLPTDAHTPNIAGVIERHRLLELQGRLGRSVRRTRSAQLCGCETEQRRGTMGANQRPQLVARRDLCVAHTDRGIAAVVQAE